MVPSNEPEVVLVAGFIDRSTVKLPVAPAKRPVPPVTVAVSTTARTPGVGVGLPCPLKVASSRSPLAAMNS